MVQFRYLFCMSTPLKQEGLHVLEREACIVCGRKGQELYTGLTDKLFGASGIWNEYTCSTCNLLFLNPYAAKESTEMLYKEYYTHEGLTNEFLLTQEPEFDNFPRNKKLKYAVLDAHFGYHLLIPGSYKVIGFLLGLIPSFRKKVESSIGGFRMNEREVSPKKLLDLGSGNGDYLLEMQYLGYEVYGIEIDDHAAESSRKNGLNVITGELQEGVYEENFFDAIYLNNVIEHLHNPAETIVLCYTLLKKGGKLCIKTCSSESLAHTYYKESYRGLEIPRHFFVFSLGSLKNLCARAGFTTIKSYTTFNGYIWSASSAIKRGDKQAAYAVGNKAMLLLQKILVTIITIFNKEKGDDIFILLEK